MGILNLPPFTGLRTFKLLDNVSAVTTGSIFKTLIREKTFHIVITGVAVVGIEGSNNGIDFSLLFPAVSKSVIIDDLTPAKHYRGRVFSIENGFVTVTMAVGG